jgi:hypothetical protein
VVAEGDVADTPEGTPTTMGSVVPSSSSHAASEPIKTAAAASLSSLPPEHLITVTLLIAVFTGPDNVTIGRSCAVPATVG